MRLNSHRLIGIFSAASLALMAGCASQGPVASDQSQVEKAAIEDTSSPAIPVTAAEVVPPPEVKKEPDAPPAPGTVASVLKKMDQNPRTLYWKERNSYSYHVGGLVNAEYKPGEGLVVKSEQTDNAVICEFNEAGTMVNANAKPGEKDQCSELMFTLDTELGE